MKFFLIFLHSFAHATILNVASCHFTAPMKHVPVYNFYPENVFSIYPSRKKVMSYGIPGGKAMRIAHFAESIPVERRIWELETLSRRQLRASVLRSARSTYQKYALSSMFIDVRVIRLLARFAKKKLFVNERAIKSATDIVVHMQNHFSGFDYLTPDYIMEWYNLIGHGYFAVHGISDIGNYTESSPQPVFVQLTPAQWEQLILKPRLTRLKRTGYEFLDLES